MISLAMIVKNEESMLARCLGSVQDLVDEMVIVDTGSTDGTPEIAGCFGVKLHRFDWCDDFAAARNESLKHCTGDWVLILDADEAIDTFDHQKIRDACRKPWAGAYKLVLRNYMATPMDTTMDTGAVAGGQGASPYELGKDLPYYTDNMEGLRLARLFDGLSFSGRIHETLGLSLKAGGMAIGKLDAVIHHYGKLLKDRESHKAAYYLELAAKAAVADPGDVTSRFNLMQQALVAERWELALAEGGECLRLHALAGPYRYRLTAKTEQTVLYGLGLALQKLFRHAEAVKYFDRLLDLDPGHALGKVCRGYSGGLLGRLDEGRRLISEGMRLQPGYIPAYGCLAELELAAKNHGAARAATLGAIDIAPKEHLLWDLLIKIELDRGDNRQAALDALQAIGKCPGGGGGKWHRLAATFLASAGENETARAILALGLKTFPDDPDLIRVMGIV